MLIDIIVPVSVVDYSFFETNIKSWLREVPFNNLYAGVSPNTEKKTIDILEKYGFKILVIQERTLGIKLAKLIELVSTEWFVYFHVDVNPAMFSMKVMEAFMKLGEIGIIESERFHYLDNIYDWKKYHFNPRAFSGFQVIRKKAIETILPNIENDYMERNEDIIFQNVCENNGYKYTKSLAMHIHQTTTTGKWVFSRHETFEKQWRGLVKYTTPTDITIKAAKDAIGTCIKENGLIREEINKFILKTNQEWEGKV